MYMCTVCLAGCLAGWLYVSLALVSLTYTDAYHTIHTPLRYSLPLPATLLHHYDCYYYYYHYYYRVLCSQVPAVCSLTQNREERTRVLPSAPVLCPVLSKMFHLCGTSCL